MRKHLGWAAVAVAVLLGLAAIPTRAGDNKSGDKIRVLLIDGRNNHDWRATTPVMKKALEATGRFTVTVATAPQKPGLPPEPKDVTDEALAQYKAALLKYADTYADFRRAFEKFAPDLGGFDVVLSNYNNNDGSSWPRALEKSLEANLKSGKIGLVIVHAANNAFGGWKEYNRMIGMGWRGPSGGERLLLDDSGKEVRIPTGKGDGSGHRYSGPFSVVVRDRAHPITKGMPAEWMHNNDELYDNMRGPIENVHLLATAYSKGTKVHEPMIWTVSYGKGRVFHTPMGHDVNSMRCVGFIATLGRGTEWAATGNVTLPIPDNFPTEKKISTVK